MLTRNLLIRIAGPTLFDVSIEGRFVRAIGTGSKTCMTYFWDRTTGPESARFRQLCSQGIGTLREHRATAPPDVDEE